MSSIDRRGPVRQRGWFAVRLSADGSELTSVAQNVSESGMLLVSRRPLVEGDAVALSLHVDPANEPPWMLGGRVVRAHRNDADPQGLWPHKVAVEFNEPMPALVDAVLAAS